jgi:acetoin utilization protein AcuB
MYTQAAMTRDVVVIPPELELQAARAIMDRKHIRHLPVVKAGKLVGILSDRDLLRYEGSLVADLNIPVAAVMTPAPITCLITTTVSRVAQMMLAHKIDSVPVVDPAGTLVGLVTSSDLLQLLVESAEIQALPFHYRLSMREEDGWAADAR